MTSERIDNILFDIGRVLLHLDYNLAWQRILPLCKRGGKAEALSALSLSHYDPVVAEYERGRAGLEQVFAWFVNATDFQGSLDQFKQIWSGIFSENKPMIEFGRGLAQSYDVYFLSNAGSLHVPRIYQEFPSINFFKDDAISCYIHALKPERAFFEKALEKFGVSPRSCLFIDDLQENVEGAVACGIRGVCYTDPDTTIKKVKQILDHADGSNTISVIRGNF